MTIRKASNFEAKQILNRSPIVMQEATLGYVIPDQTIAEKMIVPFLENGGYYLVYEDNNQIQGWIALGWQVDAYTEEPVGVILELYVFPSHRKRKLGEKLCLAAMEEMKKSGVRKVQLNVFSGNRAKRLYERLGFLDVSTWMEKEI